MSRGVLDRESLAGWNVVVTRPAEQSEELCRLIESAGGRPIRFPLIAIVPTETEGLALDLLTHLERCDWLIFVSANAVRFGCGLGDWWRTLPARTQVAAIGRSTAHTLHEMGLRVDLQPKAQFNSEALLEAPELGDVEGREIVIVRGRGGREWLGDRLRERGAEVRYAEVYQRVPGGGNAASLLADWRCGRIDALTLTSGEALRNLLHLLGDDDAGLLARTPLVVIGERLAGLAREAGFQRVAVAKEASDQALYEAVISLAHLTQTGL